METVPEELAATFLAHGGERFAPPAEVAALEGLLRRAWEDARARWPTVVLPAGLFVRHLAERLPRDSAGSPIEPLLKSLALPELYLACACAQGLPAALEVFERHYLAKLPGMLGSLKQSAAAIDDACQMARVKMLVRTPEGGPRIAEYSGRGSLLGWVHVTAVRIALKLRAGEKPGAGQDEEAIFDVLPAPGPDAELDLIKRRHHAEFRQSVREAFSALPAEDRHLLRLHFVDQLSEAEMGRLFHVHQATISRRLKRVRETVYDETRRRLQKRLGLSARDVQSFLAVLDSQLNLSISQLFGGEVLAQPSAGSGAGSASPGETSDPG